FPRLIGDRREGRGVSRGRDHLLAGRRVRQRALHPARESEAVGALARRQRGGRRRPGRGRLPWRRGARGAARSSGDSDRDGREHHPHRPQAADDSPAAQPTHAVGPLHRAHARAEHAARGPRCAPEPRAARRAGDRPVTGGRLSACAQRTSAGVGDVAAAISSATSAWRLECCPRYAFGPTVSRFTTRCTPSVCRAMLVALARPARPITVPSSVTTCLVVLTLMSLSFSSASPTKRSWTRVVIQASVMTSPVLLTPSFVLSATTFAPFTTAFFVFSAPSLVFSATD